jgi:AP-4 complex subunit epsilon-1
MLGHDASFGYIQAVKMTHDNNLLLKRNGYLVVTLFLNEDHDLIILIVNTIQKYLKLDNYLVCCATLIAMFKLLNVVFPQVVELLANPKEKRLSWLCTYFISIHPTLFHILSLNFNKCVVFLQIP